MKQLACVVPKLFQNWLNIHQNFPPNPSKIYPKSPQIHPKLIPKGKSRPRRVPDEPQDYFLVILGDLCPFLGCQKLPKIVRKSTKKRRRKTTRSWMHFWRDLGVFWEVFFIQIPHFSKPESKRAKKRPRGDSYSKNHTILKVRPPQKTSKSIQKPFKSQPKSTEKPKRAKSGIWERFGVHLGSKMEVKIIQNSTLKKAFCASAHLSAT